MDNLVLLRATAALDAAIRDAVLDELRQESAHRFRLRFSALSRDVTVVISLRPELPWIGRPPGPWTGGAFHSSPFAATCAKSLEGRAVSGVRKAGPYRIVELRFRDGASLVAELATHGANLVLLDPGGRVTAAALHPKTAAARLEVGKPYRPRPIPEGKLVPFGALPETIDRFLAQIEATGEGRLEALRRFVFGCSTAAAEMVLEESALTGASAGEILAARLSALEAAEADPVVQAPEDPWIAAREGRLDVAAVRLLPWEPAAATGGLVFRREDPASTAGVYHDAVEHAAAIAGRGSSLAAILRREIRRVADAEDRARSDVRGFGDPDLHRLQGEALLAGLGAARRSGEQVLVPDPYLPDGPWLAIAVDPALTLPVNADRLFQRHRRARRGLEAAARRAEAMRERRDRLERIADRHPDPRGGDEADVLAAAMRAEGIAVGLEPPTRKARARAAVAPARLEGVRIVTASDGSEVLVGRTGKDNDRLTFRLAAPEDFWLHAAGVPGAHVVIRNPGRAPKPSREALVEAAAWAAWFSDAKGAGAVDVQWTRCKNVRRARGAPPGTVLLKRFETVRVRPARPAGEEERS